MKKILITGSCGFIGSNLVRKIINDNLNYNIVSIDKFTEEFTFLNKFDHPKHKFYTADLCDEHIIDNIFKIEQPDIILHLAASSFVCDSINYALPFIQNNILATQILIDAAVKYKIEKFIYISTDEVYGQLNKEEKSWTENSLIFPRNPYSSSKACGEMLLQAANQTHGLQYNITRCCNNYGPRQPSIRNLIPKIISCIIYNKPIPIHGNGENIREWIYVEDHCSAIMYVLQHAPANEIFNIGSGVEFTNLEIVDKISKIIDHKSLIRFIEDRPGHDFRYSVNTTKINNLGWKPSYSFSEGITKCIKWYTDNKLWI